MGNLFPMFPAEISLLANPDSPAGLRYGPKSLSTSCSQLTVQFPMHGYSLFLSSETPQNSLLLYPDQDPGIAFTRLTYLQSTGTIFSRVSAAQGANRCVYRWLFP